MKKVDMKNTQFTVHFPSFGPIYVWETTAENAVIRAKFQRLEEGLSTGVMAVRQTLPTGHEVDCGITDFPGLSRSIRAMFVEDQEVAGMVTR